MVKFYVDFQGFFINYFDMNNFTALEPKNNFSFRFEAIQIDY